ncbi:MAG: Serine/threonine protein kinase [Chthoniobacteraceae bacterium]|nr:Serine/threonine protein kinase [Chthoniobacteraceae bacterium]
MILPNDQQWLRVEELAAQLGGLSLQAAARRLKELGEEGEPTSILTLVGGWLSLPVATLPLAAGSVVANRYTLREKLGEGGMGSVWRATQQMISRDVAIKMIHPSLVTPALKGRFSAEMEILGKLEHPGIVRIFDAGIMTWEDSSIPFYAMELVEGTSLNHWAAVHREDRGILLRLMAQICDAIQHAHDRKIVHRDLKPPNIIIRKNGEPVVLDFGIARLAGSGEDEAEEGFTGTPQYAAPEQHAGRDRDFRSGESVDVYAAGAVLFELLTGRRLYPFRIGAPIAEMRRKILEEPPTRLASVLQNCPPLLDEIVARALRRDPADRYYSIASFGRALARAATLAEGATPKPALPPWAPAAGVVVPGTHWKLAEKLGGGGAGEVWLGIHDQLDERRVFKFCDTEEKARTLKREMTLFRMLKERVGRNPHFVQLHEVSLEEAPWYLMMDCVDARELEVWCRDQSGGLAELPLEARIEIVAQVAEALQAAHESGILHRDIKPANILVKSTEISTQSGIKSIPHVLIADFGIGQLMAGELSHDSTRMGFTVTVSGLQYSSLSGTMLYMAPEVLGGNAATARSDIYSLGIVFWQLLMDDLHLALDPANGLERVSDPLLREDLTRCLCGNPNQRWPSAAEFAGSLRALPERRAAKAQRQQELARRERAAFRRGVLRTALIAAVVVVAMAGLAWYAWIKSIEAEEQGKAAAAGRARSTLGELQGLITLKSSEARTRLFQELPALDLSDPDLKRRFRSTAIAILAQPSFALRTDNTLVLKQTDKVVQYGERMITLNNVAEVPEAIDLVGATPKHRLLPETSTGMTNVSINANGRVAGAIAKDGTLHVWQSADFFVNTAVNHYLVNGPVHAGCFAFPPTTFATTERNVVAVARPDGAVDVFYIDKGDEPPLHLLRRSSPTEDAFPESAPATMLAFSRSPEGILAAAGPESNLLLFWHVSDVKNGPLDGKFVSCAWHQDLIRCMEWCPHRPEIATGARDGVLRIWRSTASGSTPQLTPLHEADVGEPIRELSWSSDATLVAVLLDSGNIQVLRAQAPDQPPLITLNHPGATHLSFLGSGTVVSWSETQTRVWGEREACFTQRVVSVQNTFVSFHQNGALMSCSADSIRFYDPRTLARTGGFKNVSDLIGGWLDNSFIYRRNNHWRRGDLHKGANPERLIMSEGEFLADGTYIISPQNQYYGRVDNGLLHYLDAQNHAQKIAATLEGTPSVLAVSDVEPLSAWVENDSITIHDHSSGAEKKHHVPGVLGLAFSPKPGLLACRTEQGVVFIEFASGQTAFSPVPAPGAALTPIAFSMDGQWIALSGVDHQVYLGSLPQAGSSWSEEGPWAHVFFNPVILRSPSPRRLVSLDWNSSGSRLACGSVDGFVQSWNLSLLRRTLRLLDIDWDVDIPPADPDFIPITAE